MQKRQIQINQLQALETARQQFIDNANQAKSRSEYDMWVGKINRTEALIKNMRLQLGMFTYTDKTEVVGKPVENLVRPLYRNNKYKLELNDTRVKAPSKRLVAARSKKPTKANRTKKDFGKRARRARNRRSKESVQVLHNPSLRSRA